MRLFNGKNLDGLFPHIDGGTPFKQNAGNVVTVHDGTIHFYQGLETADRDPSPYGVLSSGIEFTYYESRVEYKHGEVKDDGWLSGEPHNSGFFPCQTGGTGVAARLRVPFETSLEFQDQQTLFRRGR